MLGQNDCSMEKVRDTEFLKPPLGGALFCLLPHVPVDVDGGSSGFFPLAKL